MPLDSIEHEIVFIMIAGSLFFSLLAGFIIYFIILYRQKQLLHAEEQKRALAEYEHALTQSRMEIQEDILSHVSSEIHDNLGQIASLLKINLYTLPVPAHNNDKNKLEQSKELLGKLIADLKSLSLNLNTDYISENGIAQALDNIIRKINLSEAVKAGIRYPEERIRMDKGKEIVFFRMAQEILNNMLKHAEATEIQVHLSVQNDTLKASFKDNGVGFDADEIQAGGLKNKHTGLQHLKKRAELIKADLTIDSRQNKGSEFIITLPL